LGIKLSTVTAGARNARVLGFKRLSTLPRRFGAINHVCLKRRDKLL
jgi:hypothetical protein